MVDGRKFLSDDNSNTTWQEMPNGSQPPDSGQAGSGPNSTPCVPAKIASQPTHFRTTLSQPGSFLPPASRRICAIQSSFTVLVFERAKTRMERAEIDVHGHRNQNGSADDRGHLDMNVHMGPTARVGDIGSWRKICRSAI